MPDTVAEAVTQAHAAMDGLRALGEEVADEWQYIADLDAGWGERLDALAVARGGEILPPATMAAIDRATAEAALIADPHRAIDWLSTFPQIVLFALDEPG
jgi:hypothetical protein